MIILMGLLGSGKSVQGSLLAKNIGYRWLSTGEFIRENATGQLREKMLRGELLRDEELFKIMGGFFEKSDDIKKVILDGFPRTTGQAEWIKKEHDSGKVDIEAIIFLETSKDVAKSRLMSRGRPDDTEEVIERRFDEYERQTLPVVEWFKNQGIKVFSINGEQEVDKVQKDIIGSLNLG